MDYRNWLEGTWDTESDLALLAQEMEADLVNQLRGTGIKLLKTVPNPFRFSAVLEDEDGKKWMHVLTEDVRDGEGWFENVSLRRMSSQMDWKGDKLFYHRWDELGTYTVKYMSEEYDDTAL